MTDTPTNIETMPEYEQPSAASLKKKRVILPYILLGLFILTAIPVPALLFAMFMDGPSSAAQTVIIDHGTSVREITRILYNQNLIYHPILFRGAANMMADNKLKAGEYAFPPEISAVHIAEMMRDGETVGRQFTAAEGLTSHEIVQSLMAKDDLSGDVTSIPEEGSLLPESYRYSFGDKRQEIIDHMQYAQSEFLKKLWDNRPDHFPLTSPKEALILASIVEKETGPKAEERAMVAGVFYNRLRLNMALQTDPTVIYAITKGQKTLGRALLRNDLNYKSPYNTYLHTGLPPGPICNPGKAALEAVFHPAGHKFLYFVADGTGGHAFSQTLQEHNRNVTDWHRKQKTSK